MKAGGLLSILLAAALLTTLTVPAAAHHPREETASSSVAVHLRWHQPLGGCQGRRRQAAAHRHRPEHAARGEPAARHRGRAQGANDDDFVNNAADIELAGDYAFIGSYVQGLVIANISSCRDPSKPQLCKPFVQGVLKCSGGQFDVQLSPDARYVVMAHESASANKACHPSEEGAQVIDVSNKSAPREVAFISDKTHGPGRGRRAQRDARLAERSTSTTTPRPIRRPTSSASPRRASLARSARSTSSPTRRTAARARTTRFPTTARRQGPALRGVDPEERHHRHQEPGRSRRCCRRSSTRRSASPTGPSRTSTARR